MLDITMNEIWHANNVVASSHYKKVKTELQGKYKSSSSKVIQRYRNLFWLELLANALFFSIVLFIFIKIGGLQRLIEDFIPTTYVDWVENSSIAYLTITLLISIYAFYHWVFYFKYYQDFNEAILNTRSLNVKAALEVSIKSIQNFRQRSTRFGVILIIFGTVTHTISKVMNGESFFMIIFVAIFSGIFSYGALTGYYDYMHKPYQIELEILKRQLEAE